MREPELSKSCDLRVTFECSFSVVNLSLVIVASDEQLCCQRAVSLTVTLNDAVGQGVLFLRSCMLYVSVLHYSDCSSYDRCLVATQCN